MENLKDRILKEGRNLGSGILKVDSVINHQVDATLMLEAGAEFARRFAAAAPTRILTAEVSGIIPAMATAYAMGLPLVYARKHKPVTMQEPVFMEFAPSHTKGGQVSLMVSPEFLSTQDRVLIIDDFLATGQTIAAMARIVQDAGAVLVGIGTLIEKSFEGGREALQHLNVPIESMVIIEEMRDDGTIVLKEQPTVTARETIVVLDYGSQYTQLIARRVREQHVYAEILPWSAAPAQVLALHPRGVILSGGPNSVYDAGAPTLPAYVLELGVPVLGICYGLHLLAQALGGQIAPGERREYGPAQIDLCDATTPLFQGLARELNVWMSHGDRVVALPPDCIPLAYSENDIVAAFGAPERRIYALQFHPEVRHTPQGAEMLHHFLFDLCGCCGDWTPGAFIEAAVARIRAQVGAEQVICGLSGGVDSAVVAALVHRAVGDQLTCIFVDTGLLRRDEAAQVEATFHAALGMRLVAVDAATRFMEALAGVSEPETKRRIIGEQFIRVFEAEARRLGDARFLAQGTIYPDVIESAGKSFADGSVIAQRIKSHHNVGGLPDDMDLALVEPLRDLFKDEVREVGLALGLPEALIWRHPFPGPGLAVRILGEITRERVAILQAADAIFLEALWEADLYRQTAQAFAVLLPVRSVGVMGDGRTYANVIALRAVTTDDFMTADWARLPYDWLGRVANRIVNSVPGVNRVVYDISSKPPATIEWE